MKQIFISSVQKEFERERAAIKKMIESDPILSPNFKVFVFEIDAPAADDVDEIPNSVIAEAVNNAIAHRNYASIGSRVVCHESANCPRHVSGEVHRDDWDWTY